MSLLLETNNICKSFPGVKALKDVSLAFKKGEVHALVGENGAGKTTLMRVICGIYQPDSGEILLEGKRVKFQNPRQSQEQGIAIIHQELNMPVNLTIAEYIFLGRTPKNKLGMVRKKEAILQSQKLLDLVEVKRHASTKIYELNVAEQQLVEIARALSLNSKLLIMDEPTSALNQQETNNLFRIIRSLKKQDVTVIYISHKLNEIFEIADDITVMRDGCVIGTHPVKDCTHEMIVKMMTGKSFEGDYYAKNIEKEQKINENKPVMVVKNLSSNSKKLKVVSFEVYQGEVLGIAGLLGSGRTELFRAIFGADPKTQGEVIINGEPVRISSTTDAVRAGVMLLPEDRKVEGLVLQMDIKSNIALPSLRFLSSWGVINKSKRKLMASQFIKQLQIKCTGMDQDVNNLSGGNQQKVVFAKWLAASPKVLLLDDPTRGVDVGAKHEIYGLIRELASKGIGVVFVSSEMPELVGVCDRIIVMRDGEIVGEAKGNAINENNLMMIATGDSASV
ncbi:MAG: sugar ABC transporter ATP-binding protein [Bacillota bacterium]